MSLRDDLIRDEGLRLRPYRDTTGNLTIGVGRNLTARGLSREEALYLLDNDIRDHSQELLAALPWVADLDPVRRDVLLNMAFNLGVPGLLKFRATLAAVKARNYPLAAKYMLRSLWASQVGTRAQRLAKRMQTGLIEDV